MNQLKTNHLLMIKQNIINLFKINNKHKIILLKKLIKHWI
jgi:hypothetical protein